MFKNDIKNENNLNAEIVNHPLMISTSKKIPKQSVEHVIQYLS